MAATYLKVPFEANREVRSLGARFDSQVRQWYVPDGHELTPFQSWLPSDSSALPSTSELTEEAVLQRCHAGLLQTPEAVASREATWVTRRAAELLQWDQPTLLSEAAEEG